MATDLGSIIDQLRAARSDPDGQQAFEAALLALQHREARRDLGTRLAEIQRNSQDLMLFFGPLHAIVAERGEAETTIGAETLARVFEQLQSIYEAAR